MTTQTVPSRHISAKQAALALAGIGLALGGVYGVATWVSDEGSLQAPEQNIAPAVEPGDVRDPSLERLRPNSAPGGDQGVRDSWMPPGTTDTHRTAPVH